ncbi:MAG: AbrB/MazE/SpoVT family DNA-binding domain-containing protein [Oscillospiraceae bacterium]|jgi:antitoxin MazE|nr:AbrB/MazE/SpoVT family DNA-binding domain-containing protein [Oscillospiraceae bacterium]
MQATIQKWGNSQAVRIPNVLLEIACLTENEQVQLVAEPDKITIKKVSDGKNAAEWRHRTLAERLEGFEGEYVFEEWDTGSPVGREIL